MTRRTTATHKEAQDARKMNTKRETKTETSKWELRNNPVVLASSLSLSLSCLSAFPSLFSRLFPSSGSLSSLHALPITLMGVFTLDVKSVLNENLGGILGGTQR
jgi:hypothetical protein